MMSTAGLSGLGLEALGVDSFFIADRDTFSSYEVETTTLTRRRSICNL